MHICVYFFSIAPNGVIKQEETGETEYRTYDGYNRLKTLTRYGGEEEINAEYTYGADGKRTQKTVNGVVTKYIWDGDNIVMETNGAGTVTAEYNRGIGLVSIETGNKKYQYITDEHGNVDTIANASGETVNEYVYDAFGNEQISEEEIYNPYKYCGEYVDEESGLIYLRNRYYDPQMGRFITEDPIQDGMNWYVYCGNNPVMFVDPLGLAVTAKEEDYQIIESLFNELSGDSVDLEYNNGEFEIVKIYATKNHVGQKLIVDLINSPEIVNINIGGVEVINDDGTTSIQSWVMYNATDNDPIQIYIDPNDTLGLGTRGTYVQRPDGTIIEEDIPDFIHFGHELIHAWRDINGLFINSWEEIGLIPYDDPRLWREEELQTMGINYTVNGKAVRNYNTYNNIISENGLRLENGLNTRISYYYAY